MEQDASDQQGERNVVQIRTSGPSGADGPPREDRATRRLGRLESHATGPVEATGPDRRRGGPGLLPLLVAVVGIAALVWGALVLTGVL